MTTDLATRVTEALHRLNDRWEESEDAATLADLWAEYRATVAALDAARAEVAALDRHWVAKFAAESARVETLRRECDAAATQALSDSRRATQAEAERDEARAAVQAACDVAVTEAVRAIERARDEAEADAGRLRDALRDCCGGCARGDRFASESMHESSLPGISRTLCALTAKQRAALAGKEGP